MARVRLQNVSKHWGDFCAVADFTLETGEREFVVLLGPSGCGKTTTMRMIAGLEDPGGGEIYINEKPVAAAEPKDRDVAMVFQNYGLYPNMTVYENICFPLRVRKHDPATFDRLVKDAAARVKLGELLHRKPRELSGGQRQRVALARAIVRAPAVFLMDEPLSNLDAKLRMSTRAEIKNLHRDLQTTVIYVTHDQTEAMTLADRIVLMEEGRIRQIAAPMELYDKPANTFAAGFIGTPPMNLINGEINDGVFVCPGARIAGFAKTLTGKITLGIRAEDLTPANGDNADIRAPLYGMEFLGDCTLATVKNENMQLTAKTGKTFVAEAGAETGFHAPPQKCHLFAASGEAIAA